MIILEPAQSLKIASRRSLTAYFSESIKDMKVKFLHNLYSNLHFVLSSFCSQYLEKVTLHAMPRIARDWWWSGLTPFFYTIEIFLNDILTKKKFIS